MKKFLRGINSRMSEMTDKWLYKEEYAEAEQKLQEFQKHLQEKLGPVLEFMKEVLEEDLDVKPTEEDIARYFYIYNRAMTGKKAFMEQKGLWSTDEVFHTEEEFLANAEEKGWSFLRSSVGLPVCPIDQPRPGAWNTPKLQPHTVPKKDGWES